MNKAARLEPVALPNHVFATQEFILALQLHGSRAYEWDSLGELTLAKGFGASTIFHLRRRDQKSLDAREVDTLRTRTVSLDTLMPHCRALLPSTNVSVSDTAQILKHIDEVIMSSGIIRHNWNISVSYDLSRASEGTVMEGLSWDYELVSHLDEAVQYPVTLWGAADMEGGGGLRSLHKILPDGSLEPIISPDMKSTNEGGLTKRESYITLDPRVRYKLELEYSQSWSVNEKAPKIHNVFSPTNTTLNARLKMTVPSGTKVDVLVGNSALKSSDGDDARQRVFNIPSPVLKDQAIEYHVVFPVGVGKSVIPELRKKFPVRESLDGVEDLSAQMERRENALSDERLFKDRPEEIQTKLQPRILRVVVASPGDAQLEREVLPSVIEEVNRGVAIDRGLHLVLLRWETDAYPGFHAEGPQGLIDPILKISDCDLLIGIFWKRFGTPTADGKTGTEHEFNLAYEAWQEKGSPQIFVYFNEKSYTPKSKAETEQWGRVLEFREKFPKEGLWWPYNGKVQFERLVRNHLTNHVRSLT